MKRFLLAALIIFSGAASAASDNRDLLVQMGNGNKLLNPSMVLKRLLPEGSTIENLGINGWHRVTLPKNEAQTFSIQTLMANKQVSDVHPNYRLGLMHDYRIRDEALRQVALEALKAPGDNPQPLAGKDNPAFPPVPTRPGSGTDPLFNKQWGMNQTGVKSAWQKTRGNEEMIVAVLDTGVDYTHEDIIDNMWRNPGESGLDAQGRDKSNNGIDDDKNGFIDDLMGWDFAAKDNKPYDLSMSFLEIITQGGNPGHGTHCAGNVAARGENGKGISGVAPNVKIMAMRFLSEKGGGTTADAIQSIKYAVDNGAKVLSNSWGSEGEDPKDAAGNKALRDAVQYAQDREVLFIAAAGNGRSGKGYDNDTDRAPAYPASYDHEAIISVAAIDERGNLGSFSNWGKRSVDLAAPGVKVFSTVPGEKYQDELGNFFGQVITWDGTSMAAPHVSGAAALYWSAHPEKSWREVKNAILNSVKKTSVLGNKVVSGGQLDVGSLIMQ